MNIENRLIEVVDAYDADMRLFNATLDLLRVCLNDGNIDEALLVIDVTQLAIENPRV